ncbi:MAG TPA: glutathione S-transferase [Caldimonas sp.]|nr:glutathione S-transferase [Caldimonas sp.]
MSDLVLHHYETSPFSEKVRLVLGMKRLAWRSVRVPVIMPKPDVVALTGGYRRTPFMQIGADIYCDSLLMCQVIDRLAPEPPLYSRESAGLAELVAQWADSTFFWTAVPYTMQVGAAEIFAGAPPDYLKAFGADRAAMTPSLRRAPAHDGAAALAAYLGRLDSMLADGRRFLLGSAASIADFSAAQSIWFLRRAAASAALLDAYPAIGAWFARVTAFGHGESTPMTSGDAIALAAAAKGHAATSVREGAGFAPGDAVTVSAADYAHDDIAGRLVGLDGDEVVLERDDARAGSVHVHFPRIGFHVKAAKKESS